MSELVLKLSTGQGWHLLAVDVLETQKERMTHCSICCFGRVVCLSFTHLDAAEP